MLLFGNALVFLAYGGLLIVIAEGEHSLRVRILSVFGGAGIAMSIAYWLSNVFAPPLSQAHFDRAMAEQTEVIKEGNAQVVAALSDLTQQMSELSRDIRALIEVRQGDAGGSAPSGDAGD